MKKTIKAFIISSLVMLLSSVNVFADDISGYKHEKDVRLVAGLGIMNGYEDGSFKPDNQVTRAEFVTMLMRTLGFEGGNGGEAVFNDMSGHWANSNVNTANMYGIANGHDDGTFAPDDLVLSQQAATFINNALGYSEISAQRGGYPAGDISVGTELGLFKGISAGFDAPITRGETAKMIANALDAKIMEVSYANANKGTYEKGETLLSYLGYEIRNFVVTSAWGGSIDGTYISDEYRLAGDGKLYTTSFSGAVKYLGTSVKAYVWYEDGEEEIVRYIVPSENVKTLTLNSDDVVSVDFASEMKYNSADKQKTLKLSNPTIIKNGQMLPESEINESLFDKDSRIELIDNDGNEKYDTIIIWSFDGYVVTRVNNNRIYAQYNKSVDLTDIDEKEVNVFCNGEAVTLDEIKADDVIEVATSSDGSKIRIEITRNKKYATIKSFGTDSNGRGKEVKLFSVETDDGKEQLYFSDSYAAEYEKNSGYFTMPENGDSGVFYLNQSGKIVYVAIGASLEEDEEEPQLADRSKYKYGVLGFAAQEEGDGPIIVELLTQENSFEKFTITDKIKYGVYKSGKYTVKNAGVDEIMSTITKDEGQIVKYVLDENGQLTELYLSKNAENSSMWGDRTDAKTVSFSNYQIEQQYMVDATTICFYIPVKSSDESWKVSKAVTMLKSGNSYKVALYDIIDGSVGAVVYTPTLSTTRYKYILDYVNSPIMLIDKVGHKVDEASGDTVKTISGWVSGEYKEVMVSDTLEANSDTADKLKKGMLIQYLINTEKKSFARFKDDSDMVIIFNVICDFNNLKDEFIMWDYAELTDVNARIKVYKGTVSAVDKDSIYVTIDDTSYVAALHGGTSIMNYNNGECTKAEIEDITVGTEVIVRQRYNNTRDVFILD